MAIALKRIMPIRGGRTVLRPERVREEMDQFVGYDIRRLDAGDIEHSRMRFPTRKYVSTFGDCFRYREIGVATKGVPAKHENFKQKNSKRKSVMIGCADDTLQASSLKFRGDIFLDANTGSPVPVGTYLHAVAIDCLYRAIGIDEEVLSVDIANDNAGFVQACYRSSDVFRHLNKLRVR